MLETLACLKSGSVNGSVGHSVTRSPIELSTDPVWTTKHVILMTDGTQSCPPQDCPPSIVLDVHISDGAFGIWNYIFVLG